MCEPKKKQNCLENDCKAYIYLQCTCSHISYDLKSDEQEEGKRHKNGFWANWQPDQMKENMKFLKMRHL